jgi:HSP20 family protein
VFLDRRIKECAKASVFRRTEEDDMRFLAKRENTFDDLFDFRRDFDTLFNRLLAGSGPSEGRREGRRERGMAAIPPVDAWLDRKSNQYHVCIGLPGIDPKDVQLTAHGNTLMVSGESESEEEDDDAEYLQREFSYGRFERMIKLPEGVDTEKLNAEFKKGVLEIIAPMSTAAVPKKIEIKSAEGAKRMTA